MQSFSVKGCISIQFSTNNLLLSRSFQKSYKFYNFNLNFFFFFFLFGVSVCYSSSSKSSISITDALSLVSLVSVTLTALHTFDKAINIMLTSRRFLKFIKEGHIDHMFAHFKFENPYPDEQQLWALLQHIH